MKGFKCFLYEYNPYHEPAGKQRQGSRVGGRFAPRAQGGTWSFSGGPSGQTWQSVADAAAAEWARANPRVHPKTIELNRDIDAAMREAERYQDYRGWYAEHIPLAIKLFGRDNEPLFEKFLAAASVNSGGIINVRHAIHAMVHFLSGGKFDTEEDYRGPSTDLSLRPDRAVSRRRKGIVSGQGPGIVPAMRAEYLHIQHNEELTGEKVLPFYKALMGDWSQAPADRHMKRLFFAVPTDSGGNRAQPEVIRAVIGAMAKKMGWKAAELQAALWCVQKARMEKGNGATIFSYAEYLEDQEAVALALMKNLRKGNVTEAEERDRVIEYLEEYAKACRNARLLLLLGA